MLQLSDGLHLGVADRGQGRGGRRVAECPTQFDCCLNGGVGQGEGWHFAPVWEKFHRSFNYLRPWFCCVDSVAPVMLRCATEVPTFNAVNGPCFAAVWRLVDQGFGARRG